MPDCQDHHRSVVDAIPNDIATVTEVDEPLPELCGKIINHSSKAWMRTEYFHALPDSFTGPARSLGALRAQEIPQPLQVPDRPTGEYHLWHFGAGSSSSAPQLASH